MPTTKQSINSKGGVGKTMGLTGKPAYPRKHVARHDYDQRSGKKRSRECHFPAKVKRSPKQRNAASRPWNERKVRKWKLKQRKLLEQRTAERKARAESTAGPKPVTGSGWCGDEGGA